MWPICLPIDQQQFVQTLEAESARTAGWGLLQERGMTSNVFHEFTLSILNNSVCKDRFQKQGKLVSENQFGNSVICADDLNGGHDSCKGDSGGPMMIARRDDKSGFNQFYQIGIFPHSFFKHSYILIEIRLFFCFRCYFLWNWL